MDARPVLAVWLPPDASNHERVSKVIRPPSESFCNRDCVSSASGAISLRLGLQGFRIGLGRHDTSPQTALRVINIESQPIARGDSDRSGPVSSLAQLANPAEFGSF